MSTAVRWALPALVFAFFAATARGYGIFRDELYYLACADHLDWGYVDHPPMIAWVTALTRSVLGDSLVALRLVPAAAAAATVLLVGETARALGAGAWGRVLAQLLTATAPITLALFTTLSMNPLDVAVWAGLVLIATRALLGGDPRQWLAFSALAGLGLQTKLDVGLLGAGLGLGLLLTRRDVLRTAWPWAGAALALALFAPHVAWQAAHGWPTAEFVAGAQSGKMVALAPHEFVLSQLETVGPIALLLAALGGGWLLASPDARPVRPLGVAALFVLVVLALSVSKPYYLTPAYTVWFPAAGVALERWTAGRRALRVAVPVLVAAALLAAPLAKPLLPVPAYLRYASALGMAPSSDETHALGRLPQHFADMHGWRQLAEVVAEAHQALPPDERARACVFTGNYGEAGAIDHFGPALGLPPAISGHNSYWLWGPGDCGGDVLLVLGSSREQLSRRFESVEAAGTFRCEDCMPYEDGLTIWVGRGLRGSLADAWPQIRHFD